MRDDTQMDPYVSPTPVSNDPVLFESIHSLFDAHVDLPLVVYQCSEVVRINDLLWDDFQWNAHKFWVW